jgi:hypothetical protein
MNNEQTAQIVDFVAASDNRNVTPQTYGAWHLLLSHLDFEMTREATILALKDEAIRWVEPKHILSKVAKIIANAEAEQRKQRALTYEDNRKGVPMPKCVHGLGLLYCKPCCHQEAINAGLVANKPYEPRKNLATLLR